MTTIIPAILARTEEDYKKDIENVNGAGSLEGGWVHVDFMDGVFVDNKSVEVEVVSKYPTDLKKEAHLMVMQPLHWLDKLIESGFLRVIVHFEAEEVEKCVEYLKGRGVEVGLAVKMGRVYCLKLMYY
jgi:pentose-5-phosphate-3-epimerase